MEGAEEDEEQIEGEGGGVSGKHNKHSEILHYVNHVWNKK